MKNHDCLKEMAEIAMAPIYDAPWTDIDLEKWFRWDGVTRNKCRPINKNYLCDVLLSDGRVLFRQSPHDFDWTGDEVFAARWAGPKDQFVEPEVPITCCVGQGTVEAGLLRAFSDHARQFTFRNHPATPGMFPMGFPWFKAGYEAGRAGKPAPVASGQTCCGSCPGGCVLRAADDCAHSEANGHGCPECGEEFNRAPALIKTLHANGDRIAMEATIAQQAQRIADLEADKGQGERVAPFYVTVQDFNQLVRDDTAIANVRVSREKHGPFTEPLYAEQPAPVAVVMPERDSLRDIIAQAIGGDTYDCVRVWSAWGVGTMSEDDFVPVVEQESRLYEIADACLDEVTRLNSEQKP